jgi:hypothetical protein
MEFRREKVVHNVTARGTRGKTPVPISRICHLHVKHFHFFRIVHKNASKVFLCLSKHYAIKM